MKIVFAGTPDFAVAPLQKIIESGFEVVGVVTQTDKPQGRKGILTPPPVKVLAEKYSLEFLSLQDKLNKAAKKNCVSVYLYDGVHPDTAGARLIADEWMNLYNKKIKKKQEK